MATVDQVDAGTLRTFLAVAQHGSMSRAAGELGVTQQAVSLRVRRMERLLGLDLLGRRSDGVTLTENGTLVAEWATEVVASADRFAALASGLRGRDRAGTRIAASLTIAEQLLPGWLLQLRAAGIGMPAFAAANSDTVIARVRQRRTDLGFVETPDVPDDLRTRVVASDELVVVVRPDHPWTGRRSIPVGELARTPLVTREAGSGTRRTLERALRSHGPELAIAPPAAVIPTSSGVLGAVAFGGDPAVLSILAVRDALQAGTVRRIRVADLRITRPLSAIWLPSNAPSGPLEALLEIAVRGPVP